MATDDDTGEASPCAPSHPHHACNASHPDLPDLAKDPHLEEADAAAVEYVLQSLTSVVAELHAQRMWRSRGELHALRDCVVAACKSVQQLAGRATTCSDAAAAALGRRFIASRAPALALHAVSMLAVASASIGGPPATPSSVLSGASGRSNSSSGGSASSSGSGSGSRRSTDDGTSPFPWLTLQRLFSGAAIQALPAHLVPAARGVLAACVQLEQHSAWGVNGDATQPGCGGPSQGHSDGRPGPDASATPPQPPPSSSSMPAHPSGLPLPSLPPLLLLLREQLRSPGARVAQLLCLAWSLARLNPQTPSVVQDLESEYGWRARCWRREKSNSTARASLEGAKRKVHSLSAGVAGLSPVLHALTSSPLLHMTASSSGPAVGELNLSPPPCHLGPAAAGPSEAASLAAFNDMQLRALCLGPGAAAAAYQLLLDVSLTFAEDGLQDCLKGLDSAILASELAARGIRAQAGGGSAPPAPAPAPSHGAAAATDAAVKQSQSTAKALKGVYSDFFRGLPADVAPQLVSALLQGLVPAAHALPNAPQRGSFQGLAACQQDMSNEAASTRRIATAQRHELLHQARDVCHAFLEFLVVAILDMHAAHIMSLEVRRFCDEHLGAVLGHQWPQVAASVLLLTARVERCLQDPDEAGAGVEAMQQGVPGTVTIRLCSTPHSTVWFLSNAVKLQRLSLRLFQTLVMGKGQDSAEPGAASAVTAATAAATEGHAEAAEAATAAVAAEAAAAEKGSSSACCAAEQAERRVWLPALQLLEGLAESCWTTMRAVETCLGDKGNADKAAQMFVNAAACVRRCCLLCHLLMARWIAAAPQRQCQRASQDPGCCSGSGTSDGPGSGPQVRDSTVLAAAVVRQLASAAKPLLLLRWRLPQDTRATELARVAAALVLPPLCDLAHLLVVGWAAVVEGQLHDVEGRQGVKEGREEREAGAAARAAARKGGEDGREQAGSGAASEELQREAWEQRGADDGREHGGGQASGEEGTGGGKQAGAIEAPGSRDLRGMDQQAHGVLLACRKLTCVLALALCKARQEEEGAQQLLLPWEARLVAGCNVHDLLGTVLNAIRLQRAATAALAAEQKRAAQARPAWQMGAAKEYRPEDRVGPASGSGTSAPGVLAAAARSPAAAAAEAESRACLTHVCILACKLLDLVPPPGPRPGPASGGEGGASVAIHADHCLAAGWWAAEMLRWPLLGRLVALASSLVHTAAAGGGAAAAVPCEAGSACSVRASGAAAEEQATDLVPVAAGHLVALFRGLRSRMLPLARALVAGDGGLAKGVTAAEASKLMEAAREALESEAEVMQDAEALAGAVMRGWCGSSTGGRGGTGVEHTGPGSEQGGVKGVGVQPGPGAEAMSGSGAAVALGEAGLRAAVGLDEVVCVSAEAGPRQEAAPGAGPEAAPGAGPETAAAATAGGGERPEAAGQESAAAVKAASREALEAAGQGAASVAASNKEEATTRPSVETEMDGAAPSVATLLASQAARIERAMAALERLAQVLAALMAAAHESLDWALLSRLLAADGKQEAAASARWPAWLDTPPAAGAPQGQRQGQATVTPFAGGSRVRAATQGGVRKALPPAPLARKQAFVEGRARCGLEALLLQAATAAAAAGSRQSEPPPPSALRFRVCAFSNCPWAGAPRTLRQGGGGLEGELAWRECKGCGVATYCCPECEEGAAGPGGGHCKQECAVLHTLAATAPGYW